MHIRPKLKVLRIQFRIRTDFLIFHLNRNSLKRIKLSQIQFFRCYMQNCCRKAVLISNAIWCWWLQSSSNEITLIRIIIITLIECFINTMVMEMLIKSESEEDGNIVCVRKEMYIICFVFINYSFRKTNWLSIIWSSIGAKAGNLIAQYMYHLQMVFIQVCKFDFINHVK